MARNTVSRMYLSAVEPALAPLANAASARMSWALATASWGMMYCGMYAGPAGARGLCAGSVASQALNAGW